MNRTPAFSKAFLIASAVEAPSSSRRRQDHLGSNLEGRGLRVTVLH
jgi:hypothetical protein